MQTRQKVTSLAKANHEFAQSSYLTPLSDVFSIGTGHQTKIFVMKIISPQHITCSALSSHT